MILWAKNNNNMAVLSKIKQLLERIPGYDALMKPIHVLRSFTAAETNDFPASDMKVIGVTGTDGKTTTTTMIYNVLLAAGKKAGMMSTVGISYNGKNKANEGHQLTTPDPAQLNKNIAEMRDAGVKYLVLETSSHAISQSRAIGVPYDIAVMTNVSHEHLDYYKTYNNYRDTKRKLFKIANRNRFGHRIGIINADDKAAKFFKRDIKYPITYGLEKGDVKATQIKYFDDGSEFYAKYQGSKLHIRTSIAGRFNVYNALAASLVGLSLGIEIKDIEAGIKNTKDIDGRWNEIKEGQNFKFVIDYAHTPNAFEQLFSYYKPVAKGRIIAVFGAAGGRRDASKRPKMGKVAGEYADIIILTEEENRETPPMEIIGQLASGAKQAGKVEGKDLFIREERDKAIALAIALAKPGDTIFALGKGNETVLIRGTENIYWSESGTSKKLIKEFLKDKEAFRKKYL
ncbi:UDP-N-acetylmuramyl-tripeptide synthetase [Ruminococcaceae bacterium OttesenSCG-928-A11]|nr:UDP-N-acetylmuramyl-tripeptide synthetase [Ruminococcaceae bacterium OttesenSCG-928-A11]